MSSIAVPFAHEWDALMAARIILASTGGGELVVEYDDGNTSEIVPPAASR